jgi:hypothetical protein
VSTLVTTYRFDHGWHAIHATSFGVSDLLATDSDDLRCHWLRTGHGRYDQYLTKPSLIISSISFQNCHRTAKVASGCAEISPR